MSYVTNVFSNRLNQFLVNSQYPRLRELILHGATGVLHIGGHHGQEAEEYENLGLRVTWIEAHPTYFEILKETLIQFPNQTAINALLGDQNNKQTKFYVASNEGASSSILALSDNHGFEKTGLSMTQEIFLTMRTLDDLAVENQVKIFSHWVIDVQGAELKVLTGAVSSLHHATSLEVEVSTREVYKGGVQFLELKKFLGEQGLFPLQTPPSDWHGNVLFVRLRSTT